MFFNQLSKPESLVEFAHRNQAGVGSDAGALEIDLERGVKRRAGRADFVLHPLGTNLRSAFIVFRPA